MAELIPGPTVLHAAGSPAKTILEFVGKVTTGTAEVSVALMESPTGWSEPGQRPEFDEYTVVIEGEVRVDSERGSITVSAGQASWAPAGQWVRYSTPKAGGARYVAVCVPAFSPAAVHRDDEAVNLDS
jgi:quercetin dioxygenase-like cupin family protein